MGPGPWLAPVESRKERAHCAPVGACLAALGVYRAFLASMRSAGRTTIAIGTGIVLLVSASSADGQARDKTVTVTPGPEYEAGAFTRAIMGNGWRDLWTTPVSAP